DSRRGRGVPGARARWARARPDVCWRPNGQEEPMGWRAACGAALAGALAIAACAPAPGRPVPRRATLAEVVDSVASSPPLDRTHWGIDVYDPASGRTLLALNPERHFIPASNMKLV